MVILVASIAAFAAFLITVGLGFDFGEPLAIVAGPTPDVENRP